MKRLHFALAASALAVVVLTITAAAQEFEFAPPATTAPLQAVAPVNPTQPAQPPGPPGAAPLPFTAPRPGAQAVSGGTVTFSNNGGRGRAVIAGPGGPGGPGGMVSGFGFGRAGIGPGGEGHLVIEGFGHGSDDPEVEKLARSEHELERQSRELIEKYADSEDAPVREKAKAALREMLNKQFDLQNQRRDLELKRVEARLSKLREQLAKRSDARTQIVDQRLEQLVSEAAGLGWAAPGNGSPLDAAGPVFRGGIKSTRPAGAIPR